MTDRRPIASRNAAWAARAATALVARRIRPNQISQASMAFAALAGLCLWGSVWGGIGGAILLILAAAAIQGRLICNLLDGMVAVEGGMKEADGPFWNEFPDRIADILILAGAGMAALNPALGWAAASLAVLTAYTRELGRGNGLPADFGGPMAKQHRMAVLTGAAVIAAVTPLATATVMVWALWIVIAGSALTTVLRAWRQISALKAR